MLFGVIIFRVFIYSCEANRVTTRTEFSSYLYLHSILYANDASLEGIFSLGLSPCCLIMLG